MPTKDEIKEFSELIESISDNHGVTCMDAIIKHCEETDLEIELASTLVSHALKARIREEAQNLNLMKKTARLPI